MGALFISFKKLSPIQVIGNFRDFISQEPNMFGSWNLVCGCLLAFLISRNFCNLKFLPERRHLRSPLFPGYYFPIACISVSLENTEKLISREPRNIWVCDFNSDISSTRPFHRGAVRPNRRNWNEPHSRMIKNQQKKMRDLNIPFSTSDFSHVLWLGKSWTRAHFVRKWKGYDPVKFKAIFSTRFWVTSLVIKPYKVTYCEKSAKMFHNFGGL